MFPILIFTCLSSFDVRIAEERSVETISRVVSPETGAMKANVIVSFFLLSAISLAVVAETDIPLPTATTTVTVIYANQPTSTTDSTSSSSTLTSVASTSSTSVTSATTSESGASNSATFSSWRTMTATNSGSLVNLITTAATAHATRDASEATSARNVDISKGFIAGLFAFALGSTW